MHTVDGFFVMYTVLSKKDVYPTIIFNTRFPILKPNASISLVCI